MQIEGGKNTVSTLCELTDLTILDWLWCLTMSYYFVVIIIESKGFSLPQGESDRQLAFYIYSVDTQKLKE